MNISHDVWRGFLLLFLGGASACQPTETIDIGITSRLVDTQPVVAVRSGQAVVGWHHADPDDLDANEIRVSTFATGSSWAPFTRLGTGKYPKVALSSSGRAFAVYHDPTVGFRASVRFAWAWGTSTLDPAGAGGYGVGADAAGNGMAVWSQGAGMRASRYLAGSGWEPPVDLDAVTTLPRRSVDVAMSDRGTAAAVWCNGRRIRAAGYTPAGGWLSRLDSPDGCCGDNDLYSVPLVSVAIADSGAVIVGTAESQICALAGGVWTTLHAPGSEVSGTHVSVNASGVALAAWRAKVGAAYAIHARVFTPGTGWGALLTMATPVDHAAVGVGIGSTGNGAIVFVRGSDLYYVTYDARSRILNAPVALETGPGASYYVRVGSDPSAPNQGVSVWRHEGGGAIGAEVWASRLGI